MQKHWETVYSYNVCISKDLTGFEAYDISLVIQSPHQQSLPDLQLEPATFGLQGQLFSPTIRQ